MAKVGDIYDVIERNKNYQFLVMSIKNERNSVLYISYLRKAKPFEYKSPLLVKLKQNVATHKYRRRRGVGSDWNYIVASQIYAIANLPIGSKKIGDANMGDVKRIAKLSEDRSACKAELSRLKSERDKLHSKLAYLKEQKHLSTFNNLNRTNIELEMIRIGKSLGYEYDETNDLVGRTKRGRLDGFRETPSKSIKIYLGGRGG